MAQQPKPNKHIKVQDTLDYQQKRIQILTEINSSKIEIDKECFKKSFDEKQKLKELKKLYKLTNK